jgi:carbonic anhydrase
MHGAHHYQQNEKFAMIGCSDAIVDPVTVMVHLGNAFVA